MFERVIVPLDGSEVSERALPHALAIAEKFNAPVTLLHAYEGDEQAARTLAMMPAEPGGGFVGAGTVDAVTDAARTAEAEGRRYLEERARALSGRVPGVSIALMDAPAADAILQEAHREPGALVVMCTHGRSGLGKLVFGSTAQAVLPKCEAPLLLIRISDARDGGSSESSKEGGA